MLEKRTRGSTSKLPRHTLSRPNTPLTLSIHINGEPRVVAAESTVATLLVELGLQPRFVAVERNLDLVPRRDHATCRLADGDRLEIVTLVGGG